MHESLAAWCRQEKREELLWQWHPEKNEGLSPDTVPYGSKRKAWWVCEYGHEWQAEVKSRVNGAGCPHCANRSIQIFANDLATTHFLCADRQKSHFV